MTEQPSPPPVKVLSFRDLVVWQKGIDLVEEVYALTNELPKSEQYRLVSQMTRAAVSIPANVAEGHARRTRRDYAHFVSIAYGSLAELETYLILLERLALLPEAKTRAAHELGNEVGRMLNSLRQRLEESGDHDSRTP